MTPKRCISFCKLTFFKRLLLLNFKKVSIQLYYRTQGGSEAKCLTCGDPNCSYNAAKVSKDGENILIECVGPSAPSISLKRLVRNATSIGSLETVKVISNNTKFKEIIGLKAMPVTKFENITLYRGTSDEVILHVKFIKPPELVESHITQYPVLLET